MTKDVPELANSGYSGVSIRDLLPMSSGTADDETDYTNPTKGSTATAIRMIAGTV